MKALDNADAIFRMLIIDDNLEIHADFKKILTPVDRAHQKTLAEMKEVLLSKRTENVCYPTFQIDSATQGEECISLVSKARDENNPYALAFVDIRMPPGLDGVETIKKIWQIDKDVQVVICTAYSDYSFDQLIENLGQRDNLFFLRKPFDPITVRQMGVSLTKKWRSLQLIRKERIELKETITFQSLHDALTQLPNRKYSEDVLEELITRCMRQMSKFSLFLIDLFQFKLVNDSFGYEFGDRLLVQFVERLQKILRENDFLARLDSDKFLLIVNTFENAKALEIVSKKLLGIFEKSFELDQREVILTASIGVSIFPYHGKSVEELLRSANMALYRAKEQGGGFFQLYGYELNFDSEKKLALEADLFRAVKNEEFFLLYQPQYNVNSKKLVSVEALIRWNNPKKGVVSPIDFIPLAEEMGLFNALGEWVIRTACQQSYDWQKKGLPPIKVAVNMTANQFKQPNIVSVITQTLKETGLDSQYLELELTENIVIKNFESIDRIRQLKELGIGIAIDDFGTGYSSLQYLRKIPLNKLKIDQSFVKNIDINSSDEVIIKAIITMAHNLNLKVIAEGVETEEQLNFLKANQCLEVQGYLFSKPVTADEIENIVREEK